MTSTEDGALPPGWRLIQITFHAPREDFVLRPVITNRDRKKKIEQELRDSCRKGESGASPQPQRKQESDQQPKGREGTTHDESAQRDAVPVHRQKPCPSPAEVPEEPPSKTKRERPAKKTRTEAKEFSSNGGGDENAAVITTTAADIVVVVTEAAVSGNSSLLSRPANFISPKQMPNSDGGMVPVFAFSVVPLSSCT